MDAMGAKKSVLEQLMEMMDGKMMSGVPKKGQASAPAMSIEVEDDKDSPLQQKAESAVDDMDPEMLQKLLDMYAKEEHGESKQKEDEEDKPQLSLGK